MSLGDELSGNATAFFTGSPNLREVAQTLAANGGGPLSVDLALDLVLNEVVEQARTATGATGAAIALFRDGELTCRASSGDNAPDLGVKVDASSGLAGACVSTGEMQHCRDTETDDRVNAEACGRLGVRSMLIAPLVDGQRLIGVIQVFCSWPNAFGKREVSALQVLAGRIAESNREAEAGVSSPEVTSQSMAEPLEFKSEPDPADETKEFSIEEYPLEESTSRRGRDVWGTVLVVLVIVTAIALGLVIGWRRAAEFNRRATPANAATTNVSQTTETQSNSVQNAAPAEPVGTAVGAPAKLPVAKPAVPVGGLVVTENGKVVYQSPSAPGQPAANRPITRSLVHKVEPEYPAEARARHVQGPVVLEVQVLGDGAVGTINVVSGDPLLSQSAIDAVKQWRYQPQSANGQGVESQTRITVKFTLPAS